jgi:hypothetical protein
MQQKIKLESKKKFVRNSRFGDECQNAIRLKNKARQKCLTNNTKHNRTIYEEKRKVATKLCRNKKKEMMKEHIKALEQNNVNRNSRKFYKTVRTLTGEFQPRITNYKNKDGNMLLGKQEILNRWKEHFKEILTDNNKENLLIECYIYDVAEEVLNPTYEETVKIIHQLKDNKAPGNDNITSELIKVAGPVLWKQIHELITNIWEKEKIPDDWKIGIIYPSHKKRR